MIISYTSQSISSSVPPPPPRLLFIHSCPRPALLHLFFLFLHTIPDLLPLFSLQCLPSHIFFIWSLISLTKHLRSISTFAIPSFSSGRLCSALPRIHVSRLFYSVLDAHFPLVDCFWHFCSIIMFITFTKIKFSELCASRFCSNLGTSTKAIQTTSVLSSTPVTTGERH